MNQAISQAIEPAVAAGMLQTGAWLLVAVPLISAGLLLLLGKRSNAWGHLLSTAASIFAAVWGIALMLNLFSLGEGERVRSLHLFSWIPAGDFTAEAGFLIDPLSVTFVVLITFVGSLIHVYSIAYMANDPDRRRFFAYLNLFIAAMLILVLADNYALLFLGWEGVGLASYLLIGFWNAHPPYAAAAKKAFVMNRIGDFGLLVAMGLMFTYAGSVQFQEVIGNPGISGGVATAVGLTLLVAACGKSAQFPLQAWLGDAMAGPTPVSALIHAATMVTAGVYLVVRSGPIFEASATAQLMVVIIGAITLLFGAIVGMAKDDIKKALAASTMSQIGYMMLAAGLGPIGYAFAIFHLFTHGFFKAGMFLGAGSVMHGMNDQVDMRRFGGLSKYMKITWVTFGFGWLAILGIPPFSGFYSKDKIIESAFVGEGWQPWVFGTVALLGAGITAYYMSRLFFMTFHGKTRWTTEAEGVAPKPQESPLLMTLPMILLAVGSIGLGFFMNLNNGFVNWLAPSVGNPEHPNPVLPIGVIMSATIVVVLIGAIIAWIQFGAREVPKTAPQASALVVAARNDLYQDQINQGLVVGPVAAATVGMVAVDEQVIDGGVNGLAKSTLGLGGALRKLQNGYARSYATLMTLGVFVLAVIVIVTRF